MPRPEERGRRIAVLGARSELGRRLLERLSFDPGVERILALDLRDPGTFSPQTTFLRFDLTHPRAEEQLARILERERVEALLHLARPDDPPSNLAYFRELERGGMKKVLRACRGAGVPRLLLRSSTLLHWPSVRNPALLREESPFEDGAPEYIRIKREADARAQAEWPGVGILRFAPLVGSGAGGWLAKALRAPVDLAIAGYDPLIQCLHVEDASLALERALEEGLQGIFLVAPEGSLPLLAAYRLSGSYPIPLPYPLALALLRGLRAVGATALPDECLDLLRFPCVADGSRFREATGQVFRYDVRSAIAAVREGKKDA